MKRARSVEQGQICKGQSCAVRREVNLRRLPTTQGFAAIDDHARLPWRFFGRFTASIAAGLTAA